MALFWGNTATTPSSLNAVSIVKKCNSEDVIEYLTPPSVMINAGDWVLWDSTSGTLALASNVAWDSNLLTTQEDAAAVMLGIALGSKDAADARTNIKIPVVTRGFAAMPCAALGSAQQPGAGIAPAGQGTNNLSDFQIAIVATELAFFGNLVEPQAVGALLLGFFFQSPLLYGALQAA
jgi:hypothetical protein